MSARTRSIGATNRRICQPQSPRPCRDLTTKLTTKPRDFSGLTRTPPDATPHLTCENGQTRTALDQLDGIGNRVTCKGPRVQIPPSPLQRSSRLDLTDFHVCF